MKADLCVATTVVSWLELNLAAPQISANSRDNSSVVSNCEQQHLRDKIMIPSGSAGAASGRIIRILSPSVIRLQEISFEISLWKQLLAYGAGSDGNSGSLRWATCFWSAHQEESALLAPQQLLSVPVHPNVAPFSVSLDWTMQFMNQS